MKKLRISIDSLRVTSFSTVAPKRGGRGTVNGNESFGSDDCTLVFTNEFNCESGYHVCINPTDRSTCLVTDC